MQLAFLILKLLGKALGAIFGIAFGKALPDEVQVTRVIDGDSLIGKDKNGETHRIRIKGIDAPELSQPLGQEARQALQSIVQGEIIQLKDAEVDKFGRIAARIETDEVSNPGGRLVNNGLAWACEHRASLKEKISETSAKIQGKGIWSKPNIQKPWKHREKMREEQDQIGL